MKIKDLSDSAGGSPNLKICRNCKYSDKDFNKFPCNICEVTEFQFKES